MTLQGTRGPSFAGPHIFFSVDFVTDGLRLPSVILGVMPNVRRDGATGRTLVNNRPLPWYVENRVPLPPGVPFSIRLEYEILLQSEFVHSLMPNLSIPWAGASLPIMGSAALETAFLKRGMAWWNAVHSSIAAPHTTGALWKAADAISRFVEANYGGTERPRRRPPATVEVLLYPCRSGATRGCIHGEYERGANGYALTMVGYETASRDGAQWHEVKDENDHRSPRFALCDDPTQTADAVASFERVMESWKRDDVWNAIRSRRGNTPRVPQANARDVVVVQPSPVSSAGEEVRLVVSPAEQERR